MSAASRARRTRSDRSEGQEHQSRPGIGTGAVGRLGEREDSGPSRLGLGPGAGARERAGAGTGVRVGTLTAGAGARGRARTGARGRALRSELLKVATLPAMWWTLLVTAGLGAAIILSALQNDTGGRAFGFDQIAPTWTLAVQIGFVAAGVIVAGAEHSSAQGATTLLVTPARARLAAARLGALTGAGLVTASVLVSVGVVMCPEISAAALRAGGRSVVWLTAALLLAAGLGEILRSTTGAATAAVVLVVLAPQVAVIAGDAARWLPGQAGQIWVAAAGPRADVVIAGLVVLAWTAVAQAGGILRLIRSDA